MNLEEVLNYRRSVRVFDKTKPLDPEKVKHCLELATLAPNSSNMQLWEFYQVIQPELLAKISKACLDQTATSTASEVVVFVTRQDIYRIRAKFVLDFERGNVRRNSPKERQEKRIKDRELYYGKLMPFLYARFFRILGLLRSVLAKAIGLFRPIVREVSESDMRVVVHKSCALALDMAVGHRRRSLHFVLWPKWIQTTLNSMINFIKRYSAPFTPDSFVSIPYSTGDHHVHFGPRHL